MRRLLWDKQTQQSRRKPFADYASISREEDPLTPPPSSSSLSSSTPRTPQGWWCHLGRPLWLVVWMGVGSVVVAAYWSLVERGGGGEPLERHPDSSSSSSSSSFSYVRPSTSVMPTLLSLRDAEPPHSFLYALENPLYEQLRDATYVYPTGPEEEEDLTTTLEGGGDDETEPWLSVSSPVLAGGDALTVHWKVPSSTTQVVLQPTDVLALYCWLLDEEEDDDEEFVHPRSVLQNTRQLLEVGTLAQIRATHEYEQTTQQPQEQPQPISSGKARQRRLGSLFSSSQHSTNSSVWNSGTWHIPHFSVYRFSHCQFLLYQQKTRKMKNKKNTFPKHANEDADKGSVELHYLAATAPIHITSVTSPFGIHLSGTSNPSEMVVSFSTGSGHAGLTNAMVAVVVYGTSNPPHDSKVTAAPSSSQTYTAAELCMEPANLTEPGKFTDPGQLHTVLLTQLQANTRYYYQVGLQHGQGVTWSKTVYSFQSPLVPRPTVDDTDNNNNRSITTTTTTTMEEPDYYVPPFSYLVFGDQGCPENGWGQGSAWTAAMVEREITGTTTNNNSLPIRAVHHVGDLSYAKGAGHHWDAWFHMIEPYAARVPLHIAVGNHEYDYLTGGTKDPSVMVPPPSSSRYHHHRTNNNHENGHSSNNVPDSEYNGFHPAWGNFENDSGGECGVPTTKRFTMPQRNEDASLLPPSNGVFWYSHDFGNVHTIVLSSEHDLSFGSPQYTWALADLSRGVDRSQTPWVIVEMHRPLYQSEEFWDQNAVGIGMRYEIENLLFDYQVDLVVSGHYHAYLRTCDGLFRSHCHDTTHEYGGPTHITVGTAGGQLDDVALYETEWTVASIEHTYGYGRITVANATSLLFEFVKVADPDSSSSSSPTEDESVGGGDDAGTVLDHVWLQRPYRNPSRR